MYDSMVEESTCHRDNSELQESSSHSHRVNESLSARYFSRVTSNSATIVRERDRGREREETPESCWMVRSRAREVIDDQSVLRVYP
jgi:hypothetical protein